MICPAGQRPRRSPERIRAELAEKLRERRAEIEEAILLRAYAVARPGDGEDAEYLEGLRAAVAAAVTYCLHGIGQGEEHCGPVPASMLTQARTAARSGVGLQTMLRRYFAGYTALGDFLMEEARDSDLLVEPMTLHRSQKELAALFDRIVASVSFEYSQEAEHTVLSREERVAERVKRLLAGELVDTVELGYDFEAWHLGAIGSGPEAEQLLRHLAAALDRRLLLAEGGEHTVWAWLGGRHRLDPTEFADLSVAAGSPESLLVIGEPAQGLRGWRLTHRQADAALTVALRHPRRLTRYADVALIASVLRDDDLVGFLTDTYLAPLSAERDGGEALRETLRAFFAAGRNASSAAAALGIARQTVTSRLRAIEERVGLPLDQCGAEIETSLRLAGVDPEAPPHSSYC